MCLSSPVVNNLLRCAIFPVQLSSVSVYQNKVVAIRRQMNSLSERMEKVKRRVEKLHQRKMNEQLVAAERRERQLERERQLTAKPAKMQDEKERAPAEVSQQQQQNGGGDTTRRDSNNNNNAVLVGSGSSVANSISS